MADLLDRLTDALADRYRVDREIGRGGMAQVFLAQDLKLDRPVALKVLRPDLAAVLGSERFLQEIRLSAQLDHPHILPLLDSGDADGTLFYTMPYVEGESLRARLEREGQLPLEDALQLTKEVADALGHAHSRGIIHRDIKPENILLAGGHARVADFGIAKAVTEAGGEHLTGTGVSVGTPAYMSPEQADAGGAIDGRSDLYSLGCVLYEMLTGHPPFQGSTAHEVLVRHAADPVPPLRSGRSTVPEPIAAAVEQALAKVPADRYATAQQFATALDVDAGAYRRRQRALRTARRVTAIALGAVIVAAATYGTVRYRAATGWKRVALDPSAVAILPFDVRVGDPTLATLDEGIIDFLYPILSGEAGVRAIEPNPFLLAMKDRQAGGTWTSPEGPLRLAAQFRASRILEGRVAQLGSRLTLSAWLRRVPDGATVARHAVTGTADSIYPLIQALAVGLLGDQLGESAERLAALAGRPPDAVTAYLAGTQALRAARYDDAIRGYRQALTADSTFALAALRLAQTPAGASEQGRRYPRIWGEALPVARAHRSDLGKREQAALTYLLVRNRYDTVATGVDFLAGARAWLDAAPDEPEAWLALATILNLAGSVIPVREWEASARHAFERAWSLDSTTPLLVAEHVRGALYRENLQWLRRVGPQYLAVTDTSATDWVANRWAIAVALGDSASVRELRAGAQAGDPRVANWSVTFGVQAIEDMLGKPRADSDLLAKQSSARVQTTLDSNRLSFFLGYESIEKGRIHQLAEVLTGPLGLFWNGRRGRQTFVIDFWLMYPGLDSVAALAAESIRVMAAEPASRYRAGVPIDQPQYLRCYHLLYRAARGDTVGVRQAVRDLRPWFAEYHMVGICPALAEALVESHDRDLRRTPALDRLEAQLRRGTTWEFPSNAAVPVLARLLRQRGEYERALAVARMHAKGASFFYQHRVALLKQEGDLAAIVGDTTGAIAAYSRYLVFRTDPDDRARAEVDSVRAALDALLRAQG